MSRSCKKNMEVWIPLKRGTASFICSGGRDFQGQTVARSFLFFWRLGRQNVELSLGDPWDATWATHAASNIFCSSSGTARPWGTRIHQLRRWKSQWSSMAFGYTHVQVEVMGNPNVTFSNLFAQVNSMDAYRCLSKRRAIVTFHFSLYVSKNYTL